MNAEEKSAASSFRRFASERAVAGGCGRVEGLPWSLRMSLDPSHFEFLQEVAEIFAFAVFLPSVSRRFRFGARNSKTVEKSPVSNGSKPPEGGSWVLRSFRGVT